MIFLQPLDQNQYVVLHLKDLIYICLEPEDQILAGLDLNYALSNNPYSTLKIVENLTILFNFYLE